MDRSGWPVRHRCCRGRLRARRLDLAIANYVDFTPENDPFEDATCSSKIGVRNSRLSGFGTRFIDFDKDGGNRNHWRDELPVGTRSAVALRSRRGHPGGFHRGSMAKRHGRDVLADRVVTMPVAIRRQPYQRVRRQRSRHGRSCTRSRSCFPRLCSIGCNI
jgi:hypothetical protein